VIWTKHGLPTPCCPHGISWRKPCMDCAAEYRNREAGKCMDAEQHSCGCTSIDGGKCTNPDCVRR
jgi:hypothetical protein